MKRVTITRLSKQSLTATIGRKEIDQGLLNSTATALCHRAGCGLGSCRTGQHLARQVLRLSA